MSKQEIRSEIPGTFYRSASPDSPPFKEDGDAVAVGEAIGLVEVMKTFQEVRSEYAGTITFVADNDEPVMPGQVIAEVEE